MNENTNDVSKNGENGEVIEETAAGTQQETVTDTTTEEAPAPEAPPKKKKERELPDWMLDKTTVNELKFCKYFVEKHPM